MHELEKIDEAEYFYSQMLESYKSTREFKYSLSAFLSAARSVLQFALEEARTKTGGQKWYDGQVTASIVVPFFKEKRNINIHVEPVEVSKNVAIQLQDTMSISESIKITLRDSQGNIKKQQYISEPGPPKKEPKPPVTQIAYKFTDWQGSEDILILCRKYLDELKNIVTDGQNKGFLS